MTRLRRFARLRSSERGLLVHTIVLLALFRLSVWLVPFHRLRRLLAVGCSGPPTARKHVNPDQLEWAVRVGSRYLSAACLSQSLVLHWLLARAGYSSNIHIGVRIDPRAGFEAHAWVECNGRILLDLPHEMGRYTRLLVFEASTRSA